ncbi:hypothetical protein [Myroides odoratimimus]|uniref:hypothetical protein n=1 Tax=Myroides odoratimimus TaxID=76832 RepID=UPI0004694840|nr:hypothetical protein [Myroides odoratimimus]
MKVKKVVIGLLIVFVAVILGWIGYLSYLERSKQPSQLSGKEETIEVMYVNWACDCADFIDASFLVEGYEIDEKDCIFIEPSTENLAIDSDTLYHKQFDYFIKLKGQYYIDKGVPTSYERKVANPIMSPDKARVFRYTSYEFVKKK